MDREQIAKMAADRLASKRQQMQDEPDALDLPDEATPGQGGEGENIAAAWSAVKAARDQSNEAFRKNHPDIAAALDTFDQIAAAGFGVSGGGGSMQASTRMSPRHLEFKRADTRERLAERQKDPATRIPMDPVRGPYKDKYNQTEAREWSSSSGVFKPNEQKTFDERKAERVAKMADKKE